MRFNNDLALVESRTKAQYMKKLYAKAPVQVSRGNERYYTKMLEQRNERLTELKQEGARLEQQLAQANRHKSPVKKLSNIEKIRKQLAN